MAISLEAHPTLPQGFVKINGTTAATVTASGITGASLTDASVAPTKLISGPVFRAFASTGTALTANALTKVNFQSVSFDPNNCYNTSLSRFTPNIAGYYVINGKVRTDFAGQTVFSLNLFKSGTYVAEGNFIGVAASQHGSAVNDVIYFNGTTDFVELHAFSGASGTSGSGASSVYFSGAFLRS